uniref:Bestrophin homolog n=1 Tax=Macrostomum lignano TaxID=282301 RepID=A0A1I8H2G1_9PLAT
MLWVDYIFFVTAYVILAVIYHQALANHEHRMITFEAVVRWLSKIRTSVPLSFMLGFFVSTLVEHVHGHPLAQQHVVLHTQALVESTHPVKSDIARKIRITILRYSNLSWILMMATISQQIKDRFGFNQPLKAKKSSQDRSAGTTAAATAGTGNDSTDGNKNSKKPEFELTWRERLDLINLDEKVRKHFGRLVTAEEVETFARSAELSQSTDLTYSPEYWLPLAWATRLIKRSRMLGLIAEERELLFLVEMINKFRGDLGTVWSYTEFNVPLVYTQVAVAAVYLFLFSTLLSTQLIRPEMVRQVTMAPAAESINETQSSVIDTVLGVELLAYFPILGSLEFIFYLGEV